MWWSSRMVLFLTAALVSMPALEAAGDPPEPSVQRQGELLHLLRHDCGSCHGMTLSGGLGPALTREALAEKPVEYLYLTVREGHPGTPMPPWRGVLEDMEIHWLVAQLRNGVPAP